jgi:hypothetical protein
VQFNEAVPLTGITLTKLDGTAKGGILFAIAERWRCRSASSASASRSRTCATSTPMSSFDALLDAEGLTAAPARVAIEPAAS